MTAPALLGDVGNRGEGGEAEGPPMSEAASEQLSGVEGSSDSSSSSGETDFDDERANHIHLEPRGGAPRALCRFRGPTEVWMMHTNSGTVPNVVSDGLLFKCGRRVAKSYAECDRADRWQSLCTMCFPRPS